jgi:acetyl esterase/lipase
MGTAARLVVVLPVALSSSLCAHPPARGLVSWEDVSARPVPAGARRLAYGAGTLRFGDLRMPPGTGPFPVAVVIHGGCWRAENDLRHISHLADALTRAGVATWVIEYRRIGDPGGGWTGTFADVSAGTDHVRELAAQFPLDLDRVALVGHSAGGHLALWTAARHNLPPGSPLSPTGPLALRGVVSLAGITDLRTFSTGSAYCNTSVPPLLGGTVDEVPDRYAQASPIELVPLRIPQRLLHGTLDPHVPVEQSRRFETKARSLGDDVELTVLPGVGHFDLIAPWSRAWPTVERTVLQVLAARP